MSELRSAETKSANLEVVEFMINGEAVAFMPRPQSHPCEPGETDIVGGRWVDPDGDGTFEEIQLCADDAPTPPPVTQETTPPPTAPPQTNPPVATNPPQNTSPVTTNRPPSTTPSTQGTTAPTQPRVSEYENFRNFFGCEEGAGDQALADEINQLGPDVASWDRIEDLAQDCPIISPNAVSSFDNVPLFIASQPGANVSMNEAQRLRLENAGMTAWDTLHPPVITATTIEQTTTTEAVSSTSTEPATTTTEATTTTVSATTTTVEQEQTTPTEITEAGVTTTTVYIAEDTLPEQTDTTEVKVGVPPVKNNDSDSGLSAGEVVGGGIGVLVALAVVTEGTRRVYKKYFGGGRKGSHSTGGTIGSVGQGPAAGLSTRNITPRDF